ncbi:MAG: glycoside hydrolase family 125 protein [Clostridia bacterium]|nr:glycoside hydrolase family 125 protein [Clostridia bacterium]
MNTPYALQQRIDRYCEQLEQHPKLQSMYRKCAVSTVSSVLRPCEDGTWFVLTGDIPAMWLRDSAAQVTHYLPLATDPEMGGILEGVIRRQLRYIALDPYANAFNQGPSDDGWVTDLPRISPWVHERKYEVDSLCYPIRLLYLYWKQSGREEIIRDSLEDTLRIILDLWKTEQHHGERSPYWFTRPECDPPCLPCGGKGNPVVYTGMTWSGFRPSDDDCKYGYLTASQMFAVVVLGYAAEMLRSVCGNEALAAECEALAAQIDAGIRQYCVVEHPVHGKIYACETDGMGRYSMIDDANIPSLLSIPYIGYAPAEDELYRNTRRFLLSSENPYYYEGTYARGIGSPHTPERYVWHMALVMQGLTAVTPEEKREMLAMLAATDAGTDLLHEGFHVDDPTRFTREWFTWPCSLFAEFVERCVDEGVL